MPSGRSKSTQNLYGNRRSIGGQELAPRSLRKKGKRLLSECSEADLVKAGVKDGG